MMMNEMYIEEETFKSQIRPIMQLVLYFPAIFQSNAENI